MPGPIRIGPQSGDSRSRGLRSIRRPRPALSPGVRRSNDTGWADALTQRPFASPTNRTVRLSRPHGPPQRKAIHRSTNRTRGPERPPSHVRALSRSGVHRRLDVHSRARVRSRLIKPSKPGRRGASVNTMLLAWPPNPLASGSPVSNRVPQVCKNRFIPADDCPEKPL
jgi:hypothetical protein